MKQYNDELAHTLLASFYRAYLAWLDRGAEDGQFNKSCGLCDNIRKYANDQGCDGVDIECRHIMHMQLERAGIDNPVTPFNEDIFDYLSEANGGECHKNPERRKWVEYQVNYGE